MRGLEFVADLIPGAFASFKSTFRLLPSEMLKLSKPTKKLQEKDFHLNPITHHGSTRAFVQKKKDLEHQTTPGLLQQPEIPEWKWEKITMDLVTKLPRSSGGHGVASVNQLDRDGRFASHLWQALQKALGTKLNMSTAYHPETMVKMLEAKAKKNPIGQSVGNSRQRTDILGNVRPISRRNYPNLFSESELLKVPQT
ncbi:putative reverse transcriptase domain-containing protein [Tanacetum coccineum]